MPQQHNQLSQSTEVTNTSQIAKQIFQLHMHMEERGQSRIDSNMLTNMRLRHRLQHGMQYTSGKYFQCNSSIKR